MNNLARRFINENEENRTLYIKGVIENDKTAYSVLSKKFSSYLFKIYATSYINKSIILSSKEIKRKHIKIRKREELTLNVVGEDFSEERIDTIPDKPMDIIEVITKPTNLDFREVFSDKNLANAMNTLTDKQKEIMYLKFIEELYEKQIDNKLNVSIQSINKTKLAALKNIKKQLGGAKSGVFKDFINTMGFPIGVSAFLLIRIEKKLDQLNNTIIQLLDTFIKQKAE